MCAFGAASTLPSEPAVLDFRVIDGAVALPATPTSTAPAPRAATHAPIATFLPTEMPFIVSLLRGRL